MSKFFVVAVAIATFSLQSVLLNASSLDSIAKVDLVMKKGGIEWIYTGKTASLRSHLDTDASVKLVDTSGAVLQVWTLDAQGSLTLSPSAPSGFYWIVVESEELARPMYFEFYL